ncbi:MAG: hypothetical protein ACO1PM_28855 [Acidovorax sp.]
MNFAASPAWLWMPRPDWWAPRLSVALAFGLACAALLAPSLWHLLSMLQSMRPLVLASTVLDCAKLLFMLLLLTWLMLQVRRQQPPPPPAPPAEAFAT